MPLNIFPNYTYNKLLNTERSLVLTKERIMVTVVPWYSMR